MRAAYRPHGSSIAWRGNDRALESPETLLWVIASSWFLDVAGPGLELEILRMFPARTYSTCRIVLPIHGLGRRFVPDDCRCAATFIRTPLGVLEQGYAPPASGSLFSRSVGTSFSHRRDFNTFLKQVVLVLSATVLVLERRVAAEPTFEHERLDVFRLSMEYAAFSHGIAERNGKQSMKDKHRFFEIARGSAIACASIHDVLRVYDAVGKERNRQGKSNLERIVSMLT